MREIILPSEEANRRLDKFLFQYLNNAPHSFIFRLLRTKKIKLNGKRAQGNEIILPGDRLAVFLSEEQLETCVTPKIIPQAKAMPPIIFEDERVLIVNKPAGLASHGGWAAASHARMPEGGRGGSSDHLLARVLFYLKKQEGFTPALCNRLDVNTSGIIVCAKTFGAAREINALFAKREAVREYRAVVHGELCGSRTLEGFYRKDETANKAYIAASAGGIFADAKPAEGHLPETDSAVGGVKVVTAYETLRSNGEFTLLRVFPVTGRSHQIRAHLASVGHPLLGDVKYGGKKTGYVPAQLLHCVRIVLNGQVFEAGLPEGFEKCVKDLVPLVAMRG